MFNLIIYSCRGVKKLIVKEFAYDKNKQNFYTYPKYVKSNLNDSLIFKTGKIKLIKDVFINRNNLDFKFLMMKIKNLVLNCLIL